MRVRLLAVVVVFCCALASPAAGADRLKRYAIPGAGASVSVPSSWIALNARQIKTRAILDQLARENPRLAPFIESFAQSGSPVKFVALDPAVKGGFATNVNVVALKLPTSVTFEQYREVLANEVRTLTRGSKVSTSEVRVGGSQAVRLSYRFRLRAAGKAFTVQTLQYAFLRNGTSIVFTYTTTPRSASAYARTFRTSVASIRFG